MSKDFYQILGVPRTATEEELKKSYRRLAKLYHPDVNKGDKQAEEKFKEISEAYETLSDKSKRKQYDLFGDYPSQGRSAGYNPSGGYQWQGSSAGGFGVDDLNEIFKNVGRNASGQSSGASYGRRSFDSNDLGDIFGDIFGVNRGKKERERPRPDVSSTRGKDLYYSMEIEFIEAIRGSTSKISIPRAGKVEKINVKIPAGVNNGSKIRLAGKGEPGIGGGKAGDLFIEIKVKPHQLFWREGNDLFIEAPLSIGEAVLGSVIRVPTLEGHADLKIPAGTNSGQKFRLKGKGAPDLETHQVGDLFVISNIVVPKEINSRSREILEEFESLNPMNLRKNF